MDLGTRLIIRLFLSWLLINNWYLYLIQLIVLFQIKLITLTGVFHVHAYPSESKRLFIAYENVSLFFMCYTPLNHGIIPIPISTSVFFMVFYTLHIKH